MPLNNKLSPEQVAELFRDYRYREELGGGMDENAMVLSWADDLARTLRDKPGVGALALIASLPFILTPSPVKAVGNVDIHNQINSAGISPISASIDGHHPTISGGAGWYEASQLDSQQIQGGPSYTGTELFQSDFGLRHVGSVVEQPPSQWSDTLGNRAVSYVIATGLVEVPAGSQDFVVLGVNSDMNRLRNDPGYKSGYGRGGMVKGGEEVVLMLAKLTDQGRQQFVTQFGWEPLMAEDGRLLIAVVDGNIIPLQPDVDQNGQLRGYGYPIEGEGQVSPFLLQNTDGSFMIDFAGQNPVLVKSAGAGLQDLTNGSRLARVVRAATPGPGVNSEETAVPISDAIDIHAGEKIIANGVVIPEGLKNPKLELNLAPEYIETHIGNAKVWDEANKVYITIPIPITVAPEQGIVDEFGITGVTGTQEFFDEAAVIYLKDGWIRWREIEATTEADKNISFEDYVTEKLLKGHGGIHIRQYNADTGEFEELVTINLLAGYVRMPSDNPLVKLPTRFNDKMSALYYVDADGRLWVATNDKEAFITQSFKEKDRTKENVYLAWIFTLSGPAGVAYNTLTCLTTKETLRGCIADAARIEDKYPDKLKIVNEMYNAWLAKYKGNKNAKPPITVTSK